MTRKVTLGGSSIAVRQNNEKWHAFDKFKNWKFTIIAHISYDGFVEVKVISCSQVASLIIIITIIIIIIIIIIISLPALNVEKAFLHAGSYVKNIV